MKKIYSIISIAVLFCMASKCIPHEHFGVSLNIENKSEFVILSSYPFNEKDGGIYPDTTISFDRDQVGYITQPGKIAYSTIFNDTYEQWISNFPKDTVSIYIFNKDTLDAYSWEIIQRDYKILQRYDLSLEDIYALKEKNVPVIPYPPSEKMKNMKMYPPYGQ